MRHALGGEGGNKGGHFGALGLASAASLPPSGLAGGGGSKRPGTLSASSLSAGPPGLRLLAPDTHPLYLSSPRVIPAFFILKVSSFGPCLLQLLGWGGQRWLTKA